MHRISRKSLASLLAVPAMVLGVSLGALALAPNALSQTNLLAVHTDDVGTVTAQAQNFATPVNTNLTEPQGTLYDGEQDTDANPDGNGCCTATIYSPAADGTVSLDSPEDGGFKYVPDNGFTGTDSFQFTLTDGDGNVSAPATITIDVNPAGVSVPATSYSIDENQTLTATGGVLQASATDSNPSATCCTAALASPASDGTVSLDSNGDGGFTYTPDNGFTGADSFAYTLTDSVGNVSAPTNVTVDVGSPTTTHTLFVEESPPANGPNDKTTFVALVHPYGTPAETGTVTFTWYTIGAANQGPESGTIGTAPVIDNEATITASDLPVGGPQNGSITINAIYNGDANYASSIADTEYYVLNNCGVGQWSPSDSSGNPTITGGGTEGYYIGQSNGWYTMNVTQPAKKAVFTGTVTTNGLILDLSSIKDGTKDTVSLVGSNELQFKIINHGEIDGFSFYAGCGHSLAFTLDLGPTAKTAVAAKKGQIFLGADNTKSTTAGGVTFTRSA
jgi:Bacterial Ig domain